ncbi:TetR/AcrR family transcriptional regulator [Nonomuraea gerenzanensis]|uniref:Transcriptional regulator, TetR family n=1 Tax=Nonomuraea gerenzanensis TaxID=93944 RepID=A0A1M4ER23_9ACTN|nr:TetR/AcrR family transcriptional regulator [Nonomuraea gerenzanensis]UBU12704.1 TetR/AcrR family transcriptional regulator [Nonomuraea gerenzanensis]SBP01257.1 Transcriptional regulator, TetR family [Nonomuraea gerenzanensis]
MEHAERLLTAAGELFYRRGIQAVGMDDVRAASGVSLKRLYQCFPSKEALVVAYLERRDERWMDSLTSYVAGHDDQVGAVFGWLERWFGEEDFRGCGFVNAYGELGATSEAVAEVVRGHKRRLRAYLRGLVADDLTAEQLLVLVDGATVTAMVDPERGAAAARAAAKAAHAVTAACRG